MMSYLLRSTPCVCIAVVALTATAAEQTHQDFLCLMGSSSRTISIITLSPTDSRPRGACRVEYTKDGATNTVWSSETGHAYCEKHATELVTKLVESHYSCRLVTRAEPPA
jgi:hypothetical protein